jgi:hypothetical protein
MSVPGPLEIRENMRAEFLRYKALGDGAFRQLEERDFFWKPEAESNSIATLIQHLSGNLLSRWTDFLDSDGEKPWRKRDEEFEENAAGRKDLLDMWEKGWAALTAALDSMGEDTLDRTIRIRGEPHTVHRALLRGLAHCAYHVGQIVFLAKAVRSGEWKSLSIPKRKPGA